MLLKYAIGCVIAIGLLGFAAPSRGNHTDDAARPTCAVLLSGGDKDGSGSRSQDLRNRAALLESRLSDGKLVRLVERAEVERVTGELQVSAVFAADAGKRRVELGRILRADLLVFLSTAAPTDAATTRPAASSHGPGGADLPPDRAIRTVVSETKTGLRLSVAPVALTADPEADAAALAKVVAAQAGRKADEKTLICAVPPFVSNDFLRDHDHLKQAYARLIEQSLLARPECVVVELDEAHAIAREGLLSPDGPTTSVVRPHAPLYFFGEYRHSAAPDDFTVSLKLSLKRGEAELGKAALNAVKPADAGRALLAEADKLFASAGVAPLAGGDKRAAAAEASALAERARMFLRVGDWDEALALCEASLLLEADQPDLHRDAARALLPLVSRANRPAVREPERVVEATASAAALYRRAIGHYERFLSTQTFEHLPESDFQREFNSAIPRHFGVATPDAVYDEVAALDREVRAMYLRALRAQVARKAPRDVMLALCFQSVYNSRWARKAMDMSPSYVSPDRVMETVDAVRGRHDAKDLVLWILSNSRLQRGELEGVLGRLDRLPEPEVKRAVAAWRDGYVKKYLGVAPPARPAEVPGDAAGEVTFEPITVVGEGRDATGASIDGKPLAFFRCIPCDDGSDLLLGSTSVWSMTRPGVAREVFALPRNTYFYDASYDGRFFWFLVRRADERDGIGNGEFVAIVFDPASGTSREIGVADGLPLADRRIVDGPAAGGKPYALNPPQLKGFAPGRACLAGHMGRTWVAFVDCDPTAKQGAADPVARARIIHEARDRPAIGDEAGWNAASSAAIPKCMVSVNGRNAGGGGSNDLSRQIVVGRVASQGGERPLRALLIDSESGEVRVADFKLGPLHAVSHGMLYWQTFGRDGWTVNRLTPDGRSELVSPHGKRGRPLFINDKLHIVDYDQWYSDDGTGVFRLLRGKVPLVWDDGFGSQKYHAARMHNEPPVFSSRQYGAVVQTLPQRDRMQWLRVRFTGN